MSDLRASPEHLALFLAHLKRRESSVAYFYCDTKRLVTIATGQLVDKDAADDAVGRRQARELEGRSDVRFKTATGTAASAADVEADWQRVKDYGRAHPTARARDYRLVAQLRIDEASIRSITTTKVSRFCADLYQKRRFVIDYDPRVSMAFVDVLYHPARVALFGHDPSVAAMWRALDPSHAQFDPTTAVVLFEKIWAKRATPVYSTRHMERVAWLRAALLENGLQSA
ncbi:MAG: hypothetical protein JWN04_2709 [Myxococcaceae bacterium]|nr:hypothetical protein [Myxococcaceae bacterium]